MTDAVRDLILKPMQEIYLPPLHLRHDADAQARALDAYAAALAPFDGDTLQRAWENVVARQTYWVWPAAARSSRPAGNASPGRRRPAEEEQRKAKALDMADDYATQFMKTSHLAKLAAREGWSGRLRDYVTDAAFVQAQLLCHVRNVSFSTNLIENPGRFHSSQRSIRRLPQDHRTLPSSPAPSTSAYPRPYPPMAAAVPPQRGTNPDRMSAWAAFNHSCFLSGDTLCARRDSLLACPAAQLFEVGSVPQRLEIFIGA